MAVKIRLQRHGRKKKPFYYVVIADSRSSRDGKFIEKIGTYNPMLKPSSIEVYMEKALLWLGRGAEPTKTVKSLLSSKGVFLKKHLLEGVKKGAFNQEEAEKRFQAWLDKKQEKKKILTDKKASLKATPIIKEEEKKEVYYAKDEEKAAPLDKKDIVEEKTASLEEPVASLDKKDIAEEQTTPLEEKKEAQAQKEKDVDPKSQQEQS